MTNDELEAVRARAEAAHPGPWTHGNPTSWIWGPSEKGGVTHVADIRGWGYLTGHGHGALALSQEEALARQAATGAFIAHARTDIPALLDEVERLREDLEARQSVAAAAVRDQRDTGDALARAEAHAERLAKSLDGVIAVADRNTPEFREARSALSSYRGVKDEACSRPSDALDAPVQPTSSHLGNGADQ